MQLDYLTDGRITWVQGAGSVEPSVAAEIAEGSDIRERKSEAELILIGHRAQGKALIFHVETATIPVVGGLQGSVLQGV
jgi:hypothetical protein